MSDAISIDDLFDRRLDFPDIGASRRLARLGGIDQAKTRLAKVLGVLVNPAGPRDWPTSIIRAQLSRSTI